MVLDSSTATKTVASSLSIQSSPIKDSPVVWGLRHAEFLLLMAITHVYCSAA
jgi:hypothetical protein